MTSTEEKILNSPFLDAVRELRFDEAARRLTLGCLMPLMPEEPPQFTARPKVPAMKKTDLLELEEELN